jgi:maleate isomerase
MNAHAERAALELGDAGVDIVLYACLVAVMVEGKSAHIIAEERLKRVLEKEGTSVPIVTSAGALVDTLHDINASRVAIVAPYLPTLTKQVCNYLENEQIEVASSCSLSVDDNLAVGCMNPEHLLEIAPSLPKQVDAVVLSACVQMPSLDVIAEVEDFLGIPVISAATATLYIALKELGIQPKISGYGALLSGNLFQQHTQSV